MANPKGHFEVIVLSDWEIYNPNVKSLEEVPTDNFTDLKYIKSNLISIIFVTIVQDYKGTGAHRL